MLSLKIILYLNIESGSRGDFLAAKSYYDSIESGCPGGFWATRKQLSYAPVIRLNNPKLNYLIGAGTIVLYVDVCFFVIPSTDQLYAF